MDTLSNTSIEDDPRWAAVVARDSSCFAQQVAQDLAFHADRAVLLRLLAGELHHSCVEYGGEGKQTQYVRGANIAGFVKVADAMLAQGVL